MVYILFHGTAGQQRISKNFLPYFLIPVPTSNEQEKIVKKIEILFNKI